MLEPDTARDEGGRWRPGTSGNPAGRPAGVGSITTEIRRQLQAVDGDGATLAARIATRLLALAVDGDMRAIREVLDRIDGVPVRLRPEPEDCIVLAPITLGPRSLAG